MFETEFLLYQTLEDRGGYEENEEEGPYSCSWDNTWLGEGYYYWYHHIKLAHWWGKSRYRGKSYTIFESVCKDLAKCWDLHLGGGQDLFLYWIEKMKENNLLTDETSVAQVIQFIKNEFPDFPYEGIRILGTDSISQTSISNLGFVRMKFEFPEEGKSSNGQKFKAYFDPMPPVQVCLFERDGMGRNGFKLVFPDELKKENRGVEILI